MKYKFLPTVVVLILLIVISFNVPSSLQIAYAQSSEPLYGWVDMHTHPMAHLAFGGKLIHGAPDVDILMSAIPSGNGCLHYAYPTNRTQASREDRAIHGGFGFFDNTCGDDLRKAFIRGLEPELGAQVFHQEESAFGFPDYNHFPAYNDVTHQQMWVDWIHRAYDGGLRVMVSLAVNNRTLAAAVMGPGDINGDDVASANVQIEQMKRLVSHHSWMEIAYTPEDLRRIVGEGKLAIILGVEIDNIGNMQWNPLIQPSADSLSRALVTSELQTLWDQGVRYVFPIHVVDNKFGGAAIYENLFNLSNYHQNGVFWNIICAPTGSGITHQFVVQGFDVAWAVIKAKIGIDIFRQPATPPVCSSPLPGGHMNSADLTPLGEFAIEEMMRMGFMIDIDHMSARSVQETLAIAEANDYPVNSGHNGPRGLAGNENQRTDDDYLRISALGGMVGLGSGGMATNFVATYHHVNGIVNDNQLAIGTDANGMVLLPAPDPAAFVTYTVSFPRLTDGTQTWDINVDGVANYGLFADYVRSWRSVGMTEAEAQAFFTSAEGFAQMWEDVVAAQAILNSVPPTADAGGPYSANEGSSITLNGSNSSDPDQPANTLTYEWDFDNDGVYNDATGATPSYFAADGSATVTVGLRVTDNAAMTATDTAQIVIANVAPTPSISGVVSGLEGTAVNLLASAFDLAAGRDTITFNWSVTKNGSNYANGTTAAISFIPNDNATYVITLTASDEDGGSNTTTHTVTVSNVAPTPSITGAVTGFEGTVVNLLASASDPAGGQDTITLNWSVTKDGNSYGNGTTAAILFTPDDNASYVVTLTANDEDGGSNTIIHTVTVSNVAPTASLVQLPPTLVFQGLPATFQFTAISDPSPVDTAAGFDFALDCTNDGTFDVTSSTSNILDCVYPDAGVFTVRGRIRDKDGGSSDSTTTVTVLSPGEAADVIAEHIEQLREDGSLNGGQSNALLQKLRQAIQQYERGHVDQALHHLDVLLHQVETFGRVGILTETESADLTLLITRLMMSILAGL